MFFNFGKNPIIEDEQQMLLKEKIYRPRKYFELDNFRERFRLDKTLFEQLLCEIGNSLKPVVATNHALSAQDKLLAALRFYATGSIYGVLGDAHGPSRASIGRAIQQVTRVINLYLFQRIVAYPENFDNTATGFFEKGGIPSIFGCIDGTLIKILAPHNFEDQFVDRKNDHSLNIMIVCGPNLKFYDASVRWPGSVHDSRVFRNSHLFQNLSNGWRPFPGAVLLGDSGYPLRDYLLTPITNPQNNSEQKYNNSHKKTRRLIECAIGVLKESFRCLKRLQVKEPMFAAEIIKACLTLHNYRTTATTEITENEEEEENNENYSEENNEENDLEGNNERQKGLTKLRQITSLFE